MLFDFKKCGSFVVASSDNYFIIIEDFNLTCTQLIHRTRLVFDEGHVLTLLGFTVALFSFAIDVIIEKCQTGLMFRLIHFISMCSCTHMRGGDLHFIVADT
jgi:hypothetical protein